MIKITKKIAVAFTALFITAGVTTIKAQTGAALNIVSTGTADAVMLNQAISTNSLVGKTKITVETWVKPTTLAGNGCVVGNYNTPNNQLQFLLRRNGNTYLFLVGPGTGAGVYAGISTPANTASINIWQHVACVYDGTIASVYINGVISATNSISNYTFATTTNSILIGTNSIPESYDGDIDELRIWNTNRSKCEINAFMNCEIPTNATNLIANYHFNQGVAAANNPTVTTLTDATSNAYNGTLNNFALTGATGNWVTPGGVVSSFTTSTLPAVTAVSSATNIICVGQSATLTAGGANTYTWNTAATTSVIVISPTVTTNYTVTGTNALGCSNAAIVTQSVSACTGLANEAADFTSVEIFPNPSSDFFNLKVSSAVTIEVFNVLGNLILNTTINSGDYKLNLTEQSNGLYIIKCTSQGKVKSYRIIKD